MYLLPKPKKLKEMDGELLLCHYTHIVITKTVAETELYVVKRLQEAVRKETGLALLVAVGEPKEGELFLEIVQTLPEQSYELTISEKGVRIAGGNGAGLLYGVETFCQILQQCGAILPYVKSEDAPDMR